MTRVLVVDDEPQILRALRINLRARHYEVETAADGTTALRRAGDWHPDLIVLDLGLPERRPAGTPAAALGTAIDELAPAAVVDLSDEPVLGYRERMEMAAVALTKGVAYLGPDFRLDPPVDQAPLPATTYVDYVKVWK